MFSQATRQNITTVFQIVATFYFGFTAYKMYKEFKEEKSKKTVTIEE